MGFGLLLIALTGTGCISAPVSEQRPDEAASVLQLSPQSEIVLRETVLGLGGPFVRLFKQEDEERHLVLEGWHAGVDASAVWSRERDEETEASKQARAAYDAQYANAPIGSDLPEPPAAVFETIKESGTLQTNALSDATSIWIPLFWEVDKQGGDETSLIWLSQAQYDELFQTRHTQVNLGLFDDSVSYAVGLTDQVKNFVERIKGNTADTEEKSVLDIEADIDWGTYTLLVNGVTTEVQTIRAQNAFARYTILANRQNPLILELMLSPASRGSLNVFSRESLGKAFWGYEVVSITHADASTSADQPQP